RKAVVQALELTLRPAVRGRVVQGCEELQRVAQFLAAFAQVMKAFWGRLGGDGVALAQDAPVRAADDLGSGVPRVRALALWCKPGERTAPGGDQRGEARRAQRAGQSALLDTAPLREVVVERRQVFGAGRGRPRRAGPGGQAGGGQLCGGGRR